MGIIGNILEAQRSTAALPLAGGNLTGDLTLNAGKTVDGLDLSDAEVSAVLAARSMAIRSMHVPAAWSATYTGSGADSAGNNHAGVQTSTTDPSTAIQSKWLGLVVR